MSKAREINYIVASDVDPRDGIGLETYINGDLVIEIFRDDTERRTYVTLLSRVIDLDVLQASIAEFTERVGVNYLDDPEG